MYVQERPDNAVFNLRGCAVKLVKACFSDSEDQESSFHYCGCPARLVQACLCEGKTSLVLRLLPVQKNGERTWKFLSLILYVVLVIELLATHSDSEYFPV